MKVFVNGKEHDIESGISLEQFLVTLKVNDRFLAVARNGVVVRRKTFTDTVLEDGDKLELFVRQEVAR